MPLELVRDWAQEYHPSALLRSPDERQFLPAALEIIERPASPAGRMIALSICAAALFALTWATFGKIDIIATAQGRVEPIGDTKTIQPMEIGTVRAIHVADGDVVKKGQVLIELDPVQVRADRDRYGDELRRSQLDLVRLKGLWSSIQDRKPPKLAETRSDASPEEVEAARSSMKSQYDGEIASLADLDQQIAEKAAEAEAASNSIEKYQASLPFVQQQADLRAQLMELQYSNKLAYLQAQQTLVEQKHQLIVLGSQRDEAAADRLALVQKRKETAETYEKNVLDDLTKSEAQVSDLRDGEIKSQQQLSAKTLLAPIDGTVQELAIHTVGGVVTPAQTLMLVVPKTGGLVVQARVDNKDVGFVHVGQQAQVKVDTFNFTRYGLISGSVSSLSRDAVAPPPSPDGTEKSNKTSTQEADGSSSTEPSYIAYIQLSRSWMDTETGKTPLGPGMVVTAEIHTGRRRIIDYLLSPLQRNLTESMHER